MKTKFYLLIVTSFFLSCSMVSFADVTLTTSPVAASNVAQGSTNNIIYAVKMDVTSSPVTVNAIQFTLTGTHNSTDLTTMSLYFNPTAPTLSGASLLAVNFAATYAAPHTYNQSFNYAGSQTVAAGSSGYFIIIFNVSSSATNGNTVKLNGAANPVTFSYTAAQTVINNQTDAAGTQTILAASVTLSTATIPAATVAQGSTNNIIYAVKMDVTTLPVTVNAIQFTLTGTHNSTDLTTMNVYFNATAPTLSGASLLAVNFAATYAAPHTYNQSFNYAGSQTVAAGSSGYFIIIFNVSSSATNGNTIKLDGAANPVTFTYTTAPTITNSQTDVAGTKTIQAASVTLSTATIPAATVAQGSTNNIIYAVKMDVATLPVTVNAIQFTLTGTHNSTDLTTMNVYFNATAPTLSGASLLAVNFAATYAAPHTYNQSFNYAGSQTVAAGSSGYFIIIFNVSSSATNGNTIKLDGAANPVTFTYTTAPTITNSQTDVAGTKTIQAATVTLSSATIPAANVAQGSTNNIIYAVKMDVATLPVTVNYIQFTLDGTYNSSDLTALNIYFNPTAPTLSGASLLAVNVPANFNAPHTYNQFFNYAGSQTVAAGSSGYFIILFNVSSSATGGNTIKINGATNPVTFTYTTSPTVTNTQTDIAGTKTIEAGAVTLTTTAIAASNVAQGSTNNIVYAVKMDVSTLPVTVNYIQFTLGGTYNTTDITSLAIYFNPTAPTVSGASLLANNVPANFTAPHTYNQFFNYAGSQTVAAGSSGYFIIAFNVSASATPGNTVKVNGAANPVTFTYSTAPTITNNQSDLAGTQTIQAAGVTLTSVPVAAGNAGRGSTNNIVYAVKMDVTSLPVTVNAIQFTLTGTHNSTDLTVLNIYFNPTAPTVSGASLMANNIPANFAAPHTYSTSFNYAGSQTIAAGGSGYFIITFNVSSSATPGNTVKLNGATNPVTFTYTTAPPVTNNQTDAAGAQAFFDPLPLSLVSFTGKTTNIQEVQLQWMTASEFNTQNFELEWSSDGQQFNKLISVAAAGSSSQNKYYSTIHKMPVDGINFYRLKMIDKDGRFTYSEIIKINVTITKGRMIVFPNPVRDVLHLRVQSLRNETIVFNLHSADGKIVSSKTFTLLKGSNDLDWNLQQLARGNYFISTGKNNFEPIKIIRK